MCLISFVSCGCISLPSCYLVFFSKPSLISGCFFFAFFSDRFQRQAAQELPEEESLRQLQGPRLGGKNSFTFRFFLTTTFRSTRSTFFFIFVTE